MEKHEKILQPPEAAETADLTEAHRKTDELYDKAQLIITDMQALAAATLDGINSGAAAGWPEALWDVVHGRPEKMQELAGRAVAHAAEHDQCRRCLSVLRHEQCDLCALLNDDC